MEGIVTSYRRSRHKQHPDQVLLKFDNVNFEEAKKLLGKKVSIQVSKKKKLLGKIVDTHGKKGIVRARFRRGVPGQAIGQPVLVS